MTAEATDKARRQVAEILNATAAGERLLADILVGSDAAILYLSHTHAPLIGYATLDEAFAPKPARLVSYPLPEFGGQNGALFYFDADETKHRLGPMGSSPSLLYGLLAVQIYDLWDAHLRITLASTSAFSETPIVSDLFGDLRKIRQYLAHAAPVTIMAKNKILKWGETGSLRIHVADARKFRNLLIAELDELTNQAFGERMASVLLSTSMNVFALERGLPQGG